MADKHCSGSTPNSSTTCCGGSILAAQHRLKGQPTFIKQTPQCAFFRPCQISRSPRQNDKMRFSRTPSSPSAESREFSGRPHRRRQGVNIATPSSSSSSSSSSSKMRAFLLLGISSLARRAHHDRSGSPWSCSAFTHQPQAGPRHPCRAVLGRTGQFLEGNANGLKSRAPRRMPEGRRSVGRAWLPPGALAATKDSDSEGDGELVLKGDIGPELLASAFSSLDERDKYDAVLTGLCAKVLDGESRAPATVEDEDDGSAGASSLGVMEKPLTLLKEMNTRGVEASPRSVSALIDTAATTENVRIMNLALSLCIQNGAISRYGNLQATLSPFPSTASAEAREQKLEALAPVPTDDRAAELTAALTFLAVVGSCLVVKGFGPLLFDREGNMGFVTGFLPDLTLWSIAIVAVFDNFYDAVQTLVKLIDPIPNDLLPPKDDLPLNFGKGQWSGGVVLGLNRLLNVDTERECQCEAAAFFVAYSLGLPCFAFRPNALEAAVMVFESVRGDDDGGAVAGGGRGAIDPLLSDAGILKVLVWLMVPVAMEQARHPQLIASDPREASGLLRRLREKASVMGAVEEYEALHLDGDAAGGEGGGGNDDLLRWSYAEANTLLRNNMKVCEELAEGLAGGAATVGDCVAVMEGW